MSREKLKTLGINLPLLPVTSVGSFPKPDYLVKARADFAKKDIRREELEDAERKATEFWIRKQEELGADVLVDGEMYRGDMAAYFATHLTGFEQGGLVRSYGNRYYHKPIITGEVRWNEPITLGWWEYAQSLTQKPAKAMLTGPYTMMDWSFNEYYFDRRATCLALAREIRKEVETLVQAGAKVIQIDEPAISARPEELPTAIEAMHRVTDGLPAYFITHICYGAFENIYPAMLELPVDNFDLEFSNSCFDMLRLFKEFPFTKDISFGAVDVHNHIIESEPVVRRRIVEALEVLSKEAVWIDPDCGLKTRTVDEAIGKMEVLVAAARHLRSGETRNEVGT
ncbi:MAG TPA: methionine synthase [Terriglobia bacterium]|nr:methionine synthase [Terriglobia bacterium]